MRRFWLSACLALTLLGSVSLASADAQWYSPGYYNYRFRNPAYSWSITPYGSNYWYNPGSYSYYYTPPTYASPYYYGPTYYPATTYYNPMNSYYYPTYPSYYYAAPAYSYYWR